MVVKAHKAADLHWRLAKQQRLAILGQHLPAAVWRIMAYWIKPNEPLPGTELGAVSGRAS